MQNQLLFDSSNLSNINSLFNLNCYVLKSTRNNWFFEFFGAFRAIRQRHFKTSSTGDENDIKQETVHCYPRNVDRCCTSFVNNVIICFLPVWLCLGKHWDTREQNRVNKVNTIIWRRKNQQLQRNAMKSSDFRTNSKYKSPYGCCRKL